MIAYIFIITTYSLLILWFAIVRPLFFKPIEPLLLSQTNANTKQEEKT